MKNLLTICTILIISFLMTFDSYASQDYRIDSLNSEISFDIYASSSSAKGYVDTKCSGSFTDYSGTLSADKNGKVQSVVITIDTSVFEVRGRNQQDTNECLAYLKSDKMFGESRAAKMVLSGKGSVPIEGDLWKISGMLKFASSSTPIDLLIQMVNRPVSDTTVEYMGRIVDTLEIDLQRHGLGKSLDLDQYAMEMELDVSFWALVTEKK